jgi:hypothetical protein
MARILSVRLRILVTLAIVIVGSVAVACGSGTPAPTSTPLASGQQHPDPEPRVREILQKLNDGDIEGFYNNLSASRKRQTSLDQLNNSLETVRNLVGVIPDLEIKDITAKRVGGDRAEIDATLDVVLPSGPLSVTDTAKMVWESNDWMLDDHFLEQALAVIGAVGVTGETPSR